MPHRAKVREDIERQITEMKDMVETCNLAPYKKKEYEDKIRKLQDLLTKHKKDARSGMSLLEVLIVCIMIAIVSAIAVPSLLKSAAKAKEEREKAQTAEAVPVPVNDNEKWHDLGRGDHWRIFVADGKRYLLVDSTTNLQVLEIK